MQKQKYFSSRILGVFKETVNNVVVGYFVGWQGRFYGARNIRAGVYFDTAEEAIEFRDSIETKRRDMVASLDRIA